MTAYPTCRACALRDKGCERRKEIRTRIAGLGVTTLKFSCDERRPVFPRGTAVWADTWDGSEERGDEGERFFDNFPAVVVGEVDGKVIVYIEPGAEGDEHGSKFTPTGGNPGFCKISLRRIKAREADPESLCKHCDRPARLPHGDGYLCAITLSDAA